MANDPITGPLTQDELKALAAAPFGTAVREIRKHDPLFGRAPGEKFTWQVLAKRRDKVVAYVEAASQKEADELADKLPDAAFDCYSEGDIEILSVEPDKPRR